MDRELAQILFMCIPFCDLLASLGCRSITFFCPWTDFGILLGAFGQPLDLFVTLWVSKGLSLGLLGPLVGPLGMPVGPLGHLELLRGAWNDFESQTDILFR